MVQLNTQKGLKMKLKPLNSEDFKAELIEDLGTIHVKEGSRKLRFALFKCPECNNVYKRAVNRAKISSALCQSCSNTRAATKHGGCKDPLYTVWQDIKSRCYNPNNVSYHNYGGKGVTMCDEWKNNYLAFKQWADVNGYEQGLQLDKDRKCKELNVYPAVYSPKTCVFLTNRENNLEKVYMQIRELPRNVYKLKNSNSFMVQMKVNNKTKYIGMYKTVEEADKIAKEKREEYGI